MRNRTYGGVRGRKTKVGRKLLRFPPTQFIPPQVVGGLIRSATPLFLPPTCHRQAYDGNPNAVPVPMGKRPRALPFVRQRLPRPTRQAASHADFASVRLRHQYRTEYGAFKAESAAVYQIGFGQPKGQQAVAEFISTDLIA